jgi:beta-lactam-binding protein with PASTA domain
MLRFITGKPLWVNILFAVILIFILLFLFLISLDFFTRHGKTLTYPGCYEYAYSEAEKVLKDQGFDIEIQDSIYSDTAAPLSCYKTVPRCGCSSESQQDSLPYDQQGCGSCY